MSNHKIFISAGEISGDTIAADLIRFMKNIGNYDFYGLGGKNMFEAGLNSITTDVSTLNTIGFIESITRFLFKKLKLFRLSLDFIEKENIKTLIVVDNQGFSIPLGKKARAKGVKVIYYVPPRVSIWGEWNAPKIPKIADILITFLRDDVAIYKQFTNNVKFFGNPIVDRITNFKLDEGFYSKHNLDKNKPIVSILPGSRYQEVEKFLGTMLEAARILIEEHDYQILLPISHDDFIDTIKKKIQHANLSDKITLIQGESYEAMNVSIVNIMASGTATLESALFRKPPIICYKISPISFFIGKRLVPKQMIGLPNILLDKVVFPELLQKDFNPQTIVEKVLAFVNMSKTERTKLNKKYDAIAKKVGSSPVVQKVAKYIISKIEE